MQLHRTSKRVRRSAVAGAAALALLGSAAIAAQPAHADSPEPSLAGPSAAPSLQDLRAGDTVTGPEGEAVTLTAADLQPDAVGPDGVPARVEANGAHLVDSYFTIVGGQPVNVYVATDAPTNAAPASVKAASTYTWETAGTVYYYSAGVMIMWMRDDVVWWGDGYFTVTTRTPIHTTTHKITTAGMALQFLWKGVVGSGDSRYKDPDGDVRWHSYREGEFQQCILTKGCTSVEYYPWISELLYGDGQSYLKELQ